MRRPLWGLRPPGYPWKPHPPAGLPRLNRRGQQYTVFQLLQGGILAMVMLMIVWGIVVGAKDQLPTSDPFSVSKDILGSAYAAAGTGHFFTREALLIDLEFEAKGLREGAGLPREVTVGLVCKEPYCVYNGQALDGKGACSSTGTACPSMEFVSGDKITICSSCKSYTRCYVFFGANEC